MGNSCVLGWFGNQVRTGMLRDSNTMGGFDIGIGQKIGSGIVSIAGSGTGHISGAGHVQGTGGRGSGTLKAPNIIMCKDKDKCKDKRKEWKPLPTTRKRRSRRNSINMPD